MEDKTIWIVELSNQEEKNSSELSWTNLKTYVYDNNLKICRMQLRFRDHVINMPDNAKGYFFCKGCVGGFNMSRSLEIFIVGVLREDDNIDRIWFYVPELEVYKKDTQHKDKALQGLIING